MRLTRRVVVVVTVAVTLVGCRPAAPHGRGTPTASRASTASATPAGAGWQRIDLPAPPGAAGRIVLRDVTACAGRWFLTGAVAGPDGATRPAAWTSADGDAWTAVAVRADSYYGRQNVLYSAACRNGQVAAIGAKPGGAHGNPRVSTWRQDGDRALVEVEAAFETYGGPAAVNVARMAGGPPGWLIVGNRSSGAAAWVSRDAAAFELIEGAPGLAGDRGGLTWAADAVATGEGWLVVGGILRPGRIDRDPAVWSSPDGRVWRRTEPPATDGYDELQRVVMVGGTPVAVGPRGAVFGAWRRDQGRWVASGEFGPAGADGVPAVTGLAVVGDRIVAVVSRGGGFTLWISADRGGTWRPLVAPLAIPAGSGRTVTVAGAGDRLWLVADQGSMATIWSADFGPVG